MVAPTNSRTRTRGGAQAPRVPPRQAARTGSTVGGRAGTWPGGTRRTRSSSTNKLYFEYQHARQHPLRHGASAAGRPARVPPAPLHENPRISQRTADILGRFQGECAWIDLQFRKLEERQRRRKKSASSKPRHDSPRPMAYDQARQALQVRRSARPNGPPTTATGSPPPPRACSRWASTSTSSSPPPPNSPPIARRTSANSA